MFLCFLLTLQLAVRLLQQARPHLPAGLGVDEHRLTVLDGDEIVHHDLAVHEYRPDLSLSHLHPLAVPPEPEEEHPGVVLREALARGDDPLGGEVRTN